MPCLPMILSLISPQQSSCCLLLLLHFPKETNPFIPHYSATADLKWNLIVSLYGPCVLWGKVGLQFSSPQLTPFPCRHMCLYRSPTTAKALLYNTSPSLCNCRQWDPLVHQKPVIISLRWRGALWVSHSPNPGCFQRFIFPLFPPPRVLVFFFVVVFFSSELYAGCMIAGTFHG